jgi:putative ABC transport system substrate-binding protein
MTTRRNLLVVGACALAAPRIARAQAQGKVWRVGVLSLTSRPPSTDADRLGAFTRGMRELGYIEGKNLVMEWRFADNSNERMAQMAAELVQMKPDVIVTLGVPPTAALKKLTTTIPIVMGTATDPLGAGLVASLSHPGGNITGTSNVAVDISPKHLDILMTVLPKLSRVGVLSNPDTSSNAAMVKSVTAAAKKASIITAEATTPQQIESAFAEFARSGTGAVIVLLAPLFNDQRQQIAQLALKARLPSISAVWGYAEAGGLIAYGPNLAQHFHRAATFVDKILKGAKPGDLPIEQPTTYETAVNRKTAQALRVTIPQELLLRADKVIE